MAKDVAERIGLLSIAFLSMSSLTMAWALVQDRNHLNEPTSKRQTRPASTVVFLANSPYSHLPYAGIPERLSVSKRQFEQSKRHRATVMLSATTALSSRGGSMFGISVSAWQPFRATWYCSQGGSGRGLVTASGEPVRDHWTVAVDPRVIPLGSTIEVKFPNGQTEMLLASDTGGAIVGNRLDIFDHSRAECIANGVQDVEVRVFQRASQAVDGRNG